ncbi:MULTISPECIES: lytic transglycosylase domain-containing protein [unclassified Bradyrhizobium]|uniref:lytic transglycosylase domain-containing protein n=1 Tax=Bradyrhizobium sp. 84 TaxID=2782681 RepID=UPI0020981C8B|nr:MULTISPECIES: lytic transglycosylase domain-containing protein [unclassified Bradyrhizobium]
MHDRYGSPGFLAAYNAGPGHYEEHLAGVHCRLKPKPICRSLRLSSLATWQLLVPSRICGYQQRRSLLCDLKVRTLLTRCRPSSNRAPTATSVHDISAIVPPATGLFVARSGAGGSR